MKMVVLNWFEVRSKFGTQSSGRFRIQNEVNNNDNSKVFKISKINYGCFKAVKLIKKVVLGIKGVLTTFFWGKTMLVLVKCYAIKMVLLPSYLFITSLIKPEATNQQQKKLILLFLLFYRPATKNAASELLKNQEAQRSRVLLILNIYFLLLQIPPFILRYI